MPLDSLEILIPAHNEARDLGPNIEALLRFCAAAVPTQTLVTVVENGSTDETRAVAEGLAMRYPGRMRATSFDVSGRGRALRAAFSATTSAIAGYMDADLSTHLSALPEALRQIEAGADVVVGSRLIDHALIQRRWRREILSRGYNRLVRAVLPTRIRDHQCGFKFFRGDVARRLAPQTRDDLWFFDTEILILAQRDGLRVEEIPVRWIEDLGSTVRILRTIRDDLRGIAALRRRLGES